MAGTELQKVGLKHEAIAQYMLANPTATQNEVAVAFNLTVSWLSIIVNSQAFQEYVAKLNEEILQSQVIPLRDKLLGVSHLAVEKLGKAVADSQDPSFLLAAADKTLHRLGYAPKSGGETVTPGQLNVQQNIFVADKGSLEEARALMHNVAVLQTLNTEQQEKVVNAHEVPTTQEV